MSAELPVDVAIGATDKEQLFEKHARRLQAVVRRKVGTSAVNVEDAWGFARLPLRRHRAGRSMAFAWLCTTAIGEAMKVHRRTSRLVELEQAGDVVAGAAEEPERLLELIAAAQQIGQAGLRPREARLVRLRAAGYSRELMAELTVDTCRTVDRQLGRAQRKLRHAPVGGEGTLTPISASEASPTVDEVLRFEDLPPGSMASRRAVVRWSDGSEGEALRWYGDEILICEGDLVGKTPEQLRSLHFRRDRDWLQS